MNTSHPDGYPDAMLLHVALAQLDRDKFIVSMEKELKQHSELKHWKIIHKTQVPKGAKPLPMVWTLCRKQDPAGHHQMESLLMCGWSQTNPREYLLVHICSCGFLDNSTLCFHASFTTWMAYMICGFHNGVHTSQSQDGHLSSVTQRDNNPWS